MEGKAGVDCGRGGAMEQINFLIVVGLTAALLWWMSKLSAAQFFVWVVFFAIGVAFSCSLPFEHEPNGIAELLGVGVFVVIPPVCWALRHLTWERGSR